MPNLAAPRRTIKTRMSAAIFLVTGLLLLGTGLAFPCSAAADGGYREVWIWYVNETSPVGDDLRNYETIIGWLESGETEKAGLFARTLRDELSLFQAAVAREETAIESGVVAAAGRIDALLVTNHLARSGRYRYYDRAAGRFLEAALTFPPSDDYVLQSNPLVRGEALEAVLAEAARRYDPAAHRFVLITKSHGGPEHALAVRLPRHHEEISREQLLASLAGDADEIPAPPKIGVTKAEYFALLDRAGRRHGLQFSLVFMEACRGIFAPGEEQTLPTNVRLLYTSGNRSLQYSTLDYAALLSQIKPDRPFSAVLDEYLLPRYMALYRERQSLWRKLIWFAPLAAILIWFAWVLLRRRQPLGVVASTSE